MSDRTERQSGQLQLRIEFDAEAAPMPPVYANYAQGSFTPEDFVVQFGWYAPPPVSAQPEDGIVRALVQPVARVVLPLNLMPNLIALLQRQLEAYQAAFGAIPEHPSKPDWLKEAETK